MHVTKVKWFDDKVVEMTRESAVEGLFRASEFLLQKANETVPLRESILKTSGSTSQDEAALVATVSYDTPYAARQHEEVTYTHTHGRAKWLELTMQEQAKKVAEVFAAAQEKGWHR